MNRLLFISIFLLATGCSLYQSDGRKFLEKNAIQYSRAAQANQLGCVASLPTDEWQKTYETSDAVVYSADGEDFVLKIVPLGYADAGHCTFRFESIAQMIERTDSAIQLTLEQMALGLVP